MKTTWYICSLMIVSGVYIAGCSGKGDGNDAYDDPLVKSESFGALPDGREVKLFTISNESGFTVNATNYGGIITSIMVPDKDGKPGDVVLGFDHLDRYLGNHPHMGPLIGRYSGYVANGKFAIDGVAYTLAKNAGPHHLHGGVKAFGNVLWNAEEVRNQNGRGIQLRYTSPDGEEGYPGNLDVRVTYIVTDDNSLEITYEAETDKKTHVNLTNHLYFNLSEMKSPDISQHELQINATYYAVPGDGNIPTGELRRVESTPLDFIQPAPIGSKIRALENGYDHNYVLKERNDDELLQAATVFDPLSGRMMQVFTTHTGLEFASADWLNVKGKSGTAYGKRAGFLLYPQHLPDSPNRTSFPSTLLEPGQRYSETTVYNFSIGNSH